MESPLFEPSRLDSPRSSPSSSSSSPSSPASPPFRLEFSLDERGGFGRCLGRALKPADS